MTVDRESLPAVADNRFWRIEHQPKSRATPVKVTLMERLPGTGRNIMATAIGYENSIATPEAVIEAAEKVHVRSSRVDEVLGDY